MRWMPHSVRRSRMKSLTRVAMSILSVSREQSCHGGAKPGGKGDRIAATVELEQQAARLRLVVEGPVGGEVIRHRLEQVPLPLLVECLFGLLRVVAASSQIAVEEARRDLLAVDGLDRRPADDELAPAVSGRVEDRLGRHL